MSPETPDEVSDLVKLVANLMPKALPNDVREWTDPEEQQWFRKCMMSNMDREAAFDQWRRERAAHRVLAALGIPGSTVAPSASGMRYFNRKGEAVTEDEHYANLDRGSNLVAWTRERGVEVSTIHVGMNCIIGDVPMIFETAALGEEWHYATEEEARAGHARVVEMIRANPDYA